MGTLERQINDLTRTIPGNNPEIFILYQFVPCTEKIIRPNKKWGKGGGLGTRDWVESLWDILPHFQKSLRHFATFSEIFGHLWIWLSPLQKISNLWIKKILTGELVSDSDLYNIPNAFYQFSILKILLGFPSRDSAAGQLGFTKTKEQSYKRNSPWYVGKWQSLYCPLLPLGVCNFVTFFVIKKCTVWLIYWSQTSLELPKVI